MLATLLTTWVDQTLAYLFKQARITIYLTQQKASSCFTTHVSARKISLNFTAFKTWKIELYRCTICHKDELKQNIYLSSKAICKFVEREFGVQYSPEGLVHLPHRLNFVYKKTKQVPGKADAKAQGKFLQEVYVKLKASMKAGDKLYFMDGVHPQHNSMSAYGWLEKGKTREIRSNSGRQRLNLNGALSLEDYEVIIREDESINAQSTIKLLTALEAKNPEAETIYCILDNARYYRALIVKEYLKTSKVKLVFLPSCSPNLNLIERFWKFYRKKILYHRHYSSLREFKTVTMDFFKNLSSHREELATLLTENFEITGRSFSQT